jgi:hypothetical protein
MHLIDDERKATEGDEQTDEDALPKDTLEDLDVTTDDGADVRGGLIPRKAGEDPPDYT